MNDRTLQLFIDILEKIAINAAVCREQIEIDDLESLLNYLDQRNSLINIYKTLHIKMEQDYELAGSFLEDIEAFFKKMNIFDDEILTYLDSQRQKIKRELSQTLKGKESLRGYNLNSTR